MLTTIKNKKGFTLVEVIVVLVILAILAALLIPALTGYIDKANEKKIIAEARSLYIAAQAELSDAYAKGGFTAGTADMKTAELDVLETAILALSELESDTFTAATVTYNETAKITGVTYTSGGKTATFADDAWTVN